MLYGNGSMVDFSGTSTIARSAHGVTSFERDWAAQNGYGWIGKPRKIEINHVAIRSKDRKTTVILPNPFRHHHLIELVCSYPEVSVGPKFMEGGDKSGKTAEAFCNPLWTSLLHLCTIFSPERRPIMRCSDFDGLDLAAQGFLLTEHIGMALPVLRFVDRDEAARLFPDKAKLPQLYSEDLW